MRNFVHRRRWSKGKKRKKSRRSFARSVWKWKKSYLCASTDGSSRFLTRNDSCYPKEAPRANARGAFGCPDFTLPLCLAEGKRRRTNAVGERSICSRTLQTGGYGIRPYGKDVALTNINFSTPTRFPSPRKKPPCGGRREIKRVNDRFLQYFLWRGRSARCTRCPPAPLPYRRFG